MIMDLILLSIAGIALIAGTVTDIKTREVPDWVNFGLIFSGIGLRLIYSSMTFEWMYLLEGVLGLLVGVILGYLMYYTGQWGGGDAKLLMGLGALIGLKWTLQPFPLLAVFIFNVLIVGAVYGLIYSIVLAVVHRKTFVKNFSKLMHSKKLVKFRRMKLILAIVLVAILVFMLRKINFDFFVIVTLIIMFILLYLSFYLVIFVKAVELSAMYKWVEPEQVTEGDWIAENVKVDGKIITGPKDLGIEKKKIKQLIEFKKLGKVKKIKVKYGIPFVPSFLVAFILTIMLGAWWMILF